MQGTIIVENDIGSRGQIINAEQSSRNFTIRNPKMKKIIKIVNKTATALLTALLCFAVVAGAYTYIIPDSLSCMSGETLPEYIGAVPDSGVAVSVSSSGAPITRYTTEYRLLGIFPVKTVSVNVSRRTELYVGGMPFGVKFSTDGVMVVGYGSERQKSANPGYACGIRPADTIKSIDGKEIHDVAGLTSAVENSYGRTMSFTCSRSGEEYTVSLTPYFSSSENKYKSGLLVRDSGAGIGTVTYIVPNTNAFGGLGHGICDADTGALIPLERGNVTEVSVNGVVRGAVGAPGELRGSFRQKKLGTLLSNSSCGVYGAFSALPESHGELLTTACRTEVENGSAYIICTLDDSGPRKYSISISDIDRNAKGNKCFTVKVTDPALLEKTGGIVQGMSGSPIIQNGRLIGAVTHVLINDPTSGYGIFIDNMLAASPDVLK